MSYKEKLDQRQYTKLSDQICKYSAKLDEMFGLQLHVYYCLAGHFRKLDKCVNKHHCCDVFRRKEGLV